MLGGGSLLDWLGPAAAALSSPAATASEAPAFAVTEHDPAEVEAWHAARTSAGGGGSESRLDLARALEPLDGPAPDAAASSVAAGVVARVTGTYAYERLTRLPASLGVTASLSHNPPTPGRAPPRPGSRAAPDGPSGAALRLPRRGRGENPAALPTRRTPTRRTPTRKDGDTVDALAPTRARPGFGPPRCFDPDGGEATAAEVGQATHALLYHLDLSRPCDAADVRAQARDLVGRRVVAASHAERVVAADVAWFAASGLGRLLRDGGDRVRRELPVYVPAEISPVVGPDGAALDADPLDRPMVRGRVDALVPDGDGWVVVDYKTDRVGPDEVEARAGGHRAQVRAYCDAVARIAGVPPGRVVGRIVFLAARRVVVA